ncbi:MAG: glycosyltransferase family 2 protein [Candidatus Jordarchaeales archaeon]
MEDVNITTGAKLAAVASPLVSINIPTLNSSVTLKYCLEAIKNQTYKNVEVIVIDSFSSDDTVKIASEYGAKIYFAKGLFNQRLVGIHKSRGKYILLLDSDQVLEKTAVEECVKMEESLRKPKAIILNEISIPLVNGSIAKAQAEYVKAIQHGGWDPLLGTALPRFFPAKVLKEIPPTAREVGYFDHAFIYKRVVKRGVNVEFASKATIYHYEINTPIRMLKKFYKYYGFYVIPALVEDWRLVFCRLLPRMTITRDISSNISMVSQFFLYGAKALATLAGTLSYIFYEGYKIARVYWKLILSTLLKRL